MPENIAAALKGLGVTFGKPMFVREIKADTNEIVLCEND